MSIGREFVPPKIYGGLDIKDISVFSRALRLRWLWFHWDDSNRPWKGMEVPCDDLDRNLFAACTSLSIRDGCTARFWTDQWLDGSAPADLAPGLYKLAFRKKLSVKEGLHRGAWMRGLLRISSAQDLDDFLRLWALIQHVQLTVGRDVVVWNLTADRVYSAKSAYEACFFGRQLMPNLAAIWRVKTEDKVRFFMWLLLQNRLWTADRLQARGWNHDDKCCLCLQTLETAEHLSLSCPFVREVWDQFAVSNHDLVSLHLAAGNIADWWLRISSGPKSLVQANLTVACYITWNIWNERNRRIFQRLAASAISVAGMAKSDVQMYRLAHRLV